MFTLIALLLGALCAWYAGRMNENDRRAMSRADKDLPPLILHMRQEVKLICFLLMGVIVMLGIIADVVQSGN
jgi:hypothetical protein